MIFIDIGVDARGMEIPNISFRHHKIVQKGHGSPSVGESLIRTASMDLIGIMTQTVDGCKRVQVWSSCPDPSSTNDDDAEETEYLMSTVVFSNHIIIRCINLDLLHNLNRILYYFGL